MKPAQAVVNTAATELNLAMKNHQMGGFFMVIDFVLRASTAPNACGLELFDGEEVFRSAQTKPLSA